MAPIEEAQRKRWAARVVNSSSEFVDMIPIAVRKQDNQILISAQDLPLAKHSEMERPFSGQRTCARPLIRGNSVRPRKGPVPEKGCNAPQK
jgi:hypothetical protein